MTDNSLFIVCKSGKSIKSNLFSLTKIEKYTLNSRLIKIGICPTGRYLGLLNI